MSIRLKLIDIWSSDVDDVTNWNPKNTLNVYIQLYIAIGEENSNNEYEFQVEVGTPDGLKAWSEEYKLDLISDRNLILVREYSFDHIKSVIEKILVKCQSDTWEKSVLNLQRYFLWEYEDFKRENG